MKREIYVLFHPEDIHTNHLKHNQIYNKYCSSPSEGNGPHNLCVNALHYDKVIDESSFCERLRHWALKDSRPVATEDGFLTNRIDNDAWDKKFQKWVKDLTKVSLKPCLKRIIILCLLKSKSRSRLRGTKCGLSGLDNLSKKPESGS